MELNVISLDSSFLIERILTSFIPLKLSLHFTVKINLHELFALHKLYDADGLSTTNSEIFIMLLEMALIILNSMRN